MMKTLILIVTMPVTSRPNKLISDKGVNEILSWERNVSKSKANGRKLNSPMRGEEMSAKTNNFF